MMPSIRRAAVLALLLATLPPPAHADAAHTRTLANGLRIAVIPAPEATAVEVRLDFAAGSDADPDSLAGLAHVVEHLMFDASESMPAADMARSRTLATLSSNATTSQDRMSFFSTCLPEFLPQVLAMEAARFAPPAADPSVFAREQAVIQQELAFREHRSPTWEAVWTLAGVLEGRPLDYPGPGGTPQTVARITPADVRAYHARHLVPANAVLVIRGPVDAGTVSTQAESVFGPLPPAPAAATAPLPDPDVPNPQIIQDDPSRTGFLLLLGARLPLTTIVDDLLLDHLETWVPLERSRWQRTRRRADGLAVMLGSFRYLVIPEHLEGGGTVDADQSVVMARTYVREELEAELARLQDPGIFAARREEVRRALERPRDLDAADLADRMLGLRPRSEPSALLAVLDSLQPGDLVPRLLAATRAERTGLMVVHGRDSGRDAALDVVRRRERGEPSPVPPPPPPPADQIRDALAIYAAAASDSVHLRTLDHGVKLIYRRLPGADRLHVLLRRDTDGAELEKPGRDRGRAFWYNLIADEGTASSTRDDGTLARGDKPFGLSVRFLGDRLELSAHGRPSEASDLLAHLARRLGSDDFNIGVWGRLIQDHEQLQDAFTRDPTAAAASFRYRYQFGADAPELSALDPSPELGARIRYDELRKFHRRITRKDGGTTVFAVGPEPPDAFFAAAAAELSGLDSSPPPPHTPRRAAAGPRGRVVSDFQAHDVRLTLMFPEPAAPVPPAVRAVAEQLVTIRLGDVLRQELGLSYAVGVHTASLGRRRFGEIALTVHPEQAPRALGVLARELERLVDGQTDAVDAALARLAAVKRELVRGPDGERAVRDLSLNDGVLTGADAARVTGHALNAALAALYPRDAWCVTVTGPLFREDIDQFLTADGAVADRSP